MNTPSPPFLTMTSSQLTRKTLKTCIRHFTWSWHTVVMGTGGVAGLISRFHFGQDSEAIKYLTLLFFFLNLVFFVAICSATVARYWMFPELWDAMLQHPTQSLFIGAFPMGAATLINTALTINQTYHFSGPGFVYALWVFWWLDCAVSLLTAVGMILVMVTKQKHSLGQITTLWLLPVVTLIVASSTGGLLASALMHHHPTYATLTTAVSFMLLLIGLSLAGMIVTVYLMRLVLYGLDTSLILSTFIILGPLGQGGFSFLVNGQNAARIALPAALSPAAIETATFCCAYALWSMALMWLSIGLCSVGSVLRRQSIPFSVAHWGTIFPNALVALLTVELGVVLESRTLDYLGAILSGELRLMFSMLLFLVWLANGVVTQCWFFMLWCYVFARTIPAVWNTSVFNSPCASKLDEQPLMPLEHSNV
ncbi:Sulfite efflux pump SSU1 [Mycena sanguinolenta]|uniref:Sulfite efflux pump SSU1 n=1 Tax=Mycena sanguinolenta TaxID=230812 RepID=A0A8H7DI52_9AGAR|nr:Sulfite efflux pump SSU1 [Mycena sanguinolenta]